MTGKDRMVADLKAQHEANRREYEDKQRKARIDAKEPIVDPALFTHLENNRRAAPPQQQQPQPQAPSVPRKAPAAPRTAPQAQSARPAHKKAPRREGAPISPEAARAAAARRAAEEERRKREKAEKEKKKEEKKKSVLAIRHAVMGYFGISICILLIICGIAASIFLLGLTSHDEAETLPDKLIYYAGKDKTSLPYSSVYIGGKYFVNMTDIAARAGLTMSGDSESMVFSAPPNEKAIFTVGAGHALVNGVSVNMGAPCFLRDGSLWVSADFADRYISGVSVTLSDDKTTLTVEIGEACSFLLKNEAPLDTPTVDDLPPSVVILPSDTPRYEFTNDLSSYYKYMDPADRDAFLLLINPSRPFDATYEPPDLTSVLNVKKGKNYTMSLYAEKALEALFVEMYAAGYTDVVVTMAYRSYEAQEKQFNTYVYNERYYYRTNFEATGKWFSDAAYKALGESYIKEKYISKGKTTLTKEDAERVVRSYSAAPGTGDHQTGFSCDMHNLSSTSVKFEKEEAYAWLLENAHKFGFIQRYPKDKEKITGMSFEPYHWRFVGQYHAAVMRENGLCLEEYVALLEKE
ncbi:MAG: D-alanyl-D-alanine carboxypeptidase family protein [Clostridia bacterium]|nr:D-alanyl-D-alanine carboxypeptidase family protein [Clostridia bacterium]